MPTVPGANWADLETLARWVRRQRYCRDLLHQGTPELIHTATGVAVKVRPDLLIRSRAGRQLTLVDFKTTSAPTCPTPWSPPSGTTTTAKPPCIWTY